MAKESIYHYITRMSSQYPGLPYSFQNLQVAGSRDVKYLLWEDGISFLLKEKFAKALVDQVEKCVKTEEVSDELKKIMESRPIVLYLDKLILRIKLCLSEKIIDKMQLYEFGIKLATNSENEEEVKLGMIILGFYENDITTQILKVLGLHSSLTIYALEASKNHMNSNEFAFELARNTSGYGKLASLYTMEPLSDFEKQWVLTKGWKNEIAPNLCAVLCLQKVDMEEYYISCQINQDNFTSFSHLIAYAFEKNNLNEIAQSRFIVPKYLNAARNHAHLFIDLAALVILEKGMDFDWNKEDFELFNEILKQPKWTNVALSQLNDPEYESSFIMMTLGRLKAVPSFDSFIPLFQRDLFDMEVLKHMLVDHAEVYVDEVFGYLQNVLPNEVFNEGPMDIPEDEFDGKYKPDIWLMYLLRALRREKKNEEEFFMNCLKCRFPSVRVEAIHGLRVNKLSWSHNIIPALENALEIEPVKRIKKRILRLLENNEDVQKEQRYVDLAGIQVTPTSLDSLVLDTEIAGTVYRDMLVVEDQIEEGDVLYLIREPDNKDDKNSILVTAEDGYVLGYIPKGVNVNLAAMIDSGEKLYAVLKSSGINYGRPAIKIILSKQNDEGKIIKFPFKTN
ncbi:MAG: HIRAN domain-containing protein [Solirubrobacterales bacterium]